MRQVYCFACSAVGGGKLATMVNVLVDSNPERARAIARADLMNNCPPSQGWADHTVTKGVVIPEAVLRLVFDGQEPTE